MRSLLICSAGLLLTANLFAQTPTQKIYPINFSKVAIEDHFWSPQLEKVATATLDACVSYTEDKTGRIRNFEKAALGSGKHEGIYYDDSDVYKAIEAIAYSLKNYPDKELEANTDQWIDKIAAAQQPDGYLNTYYTLTGLQDRWKDMERHEDYCAGHLIEAGIAYYNTTGKDKLLKVATKFADHIDNYFRIANKPWVSGHQEIELALMKLYHHTKEDRYLALADWFVEQRGKGYGVGKIWDEWKAPEYAQDDVPVRDQRKITGHAVRAMYLYTGIADIASETKDVGYLKTMDAIWDDVLNKHYYITGGIGASGSNEGFGKPFELPNETAYCETCASVGMVFWNQRMNMLSAQSKYIDVLERTLYNAAIDGMSLTGNRFFYGNPLASNGNYERSEWFGTACCPSNIARLVSSLGSYIYSRSATDLYVNLFVGSETTLDLNKNEVFVKQTGNYPWNGEVSIEVSPKKSREFAVYVRIPGWLKQPVPSSLYAYESNKVNEYTITINGKPKVGVEEDGYLKLNRKWKKGDKIDLKMNMEVRRIVSSDELKDNHNKVALQYGPIVYAVEDIDNPNAKNGLFLPEGTEFQVNYKADLLGGTNVIQFKAPIVSIDQSQGKVVQEEKEITAIPYFLWNNRGKSAMQVWIPEKLTSVRVN